MSKIQGLYGFTSAVGGISPERAYLARIIRDMPPNWIKGKSLSLVSNWGGLGDQFANIVGGLFISQKLGTDHFFFKDIPNNVHSVDISTILSSTVKWCPSPIDIAPSFPYDLHIPSNIGNKDCTVTLGVTMSPDLQISAIRDAAMYTISSNRFSIWNISQIGWSIPDELLPVVTRVLKPVPKELCTPPRNAIGVHIRRGDRSNNPSLPGTNLEKAKSLMEAYHEEHTDCSLGVFTDEPGTVRKALQDLSYVTMISNETRNSVSDLYSLAQHSSIMHLGTWSGFQGLAAIIHQVLYNNVQKVIYPPP